MRRLILYVLLCLLRCCLNNLVDTLIYVFADNPPIGKGSISKGDENSDTSQSKVLRDSKIYKNLVPNKVSWADLC